MRPICTETPEDRLGNRCQKGADHGRHDDGRRGGCPVGDGAGLLGLRGLIGRYNVTFTDPDTMKFDLVEEECEARGASAGPWVRVQGK